MVKKIVFIFICVWQIFPLWGIAPPVFSVNNFSEYFYEEKRRLFDKFFQDLKDGIQKDGFSCGEFQYFEDRFLILYNAEDRHEFSVFRESLKEMFLSFEDVDCALRERVNGVLYRIFIKSKYLELLSYCPLLRDENSVFLVLKSFENYCDDDEEKACAVMVQIMSPFVEYSYRWVKLLWNEIRCQCPYLSTLVDWSLHPELIYNEEEGWEDVLLSLQFSSLQFFLHDFIDPKNCDGDGNSILHIVMRERGDEYKEIRDRVLEVYLDFLDSKNFLGKTPVHIAVQHNPEGFLSLIDEGVFILPEEDQSRTYSGETYLHLAAKGRHEEVVCFLMNNGYSSQKKNYRGQSPLFFTVGGHLPIYVCVGRLIRLLTPCREGINLQDDDGHTALHIAVQHGQYMLINELVCRGANITIQNKKGRTVLHDWALRDNHYEDWTFLKSICDDDLLKIQDHEGHTVFHIAAQYNNKDVLDFLFSKDVGLRIKNNKGHTPLLHVMHEGGHDDMKKFLTQAKNHHVVWQEQDVEEVFNYARKQSDALFCFIMLNAVYSDMAPDEKERWKKEFFNILAECPPALFSFDASVLLWKTDLSRELRDPFINMVVKNDVPIRLEFLYSTVFDGDPLGLFLDKVPDNYPLVTEDFGTTLMAFIALHCLKLEHSFSPYQDICLKLISKGSGVNELTAHGTPLSHLLYVMSVFIDNDEDKVKRESYPILEKLLDVYSPDVVVRKGQTLDPSEADRQHRGIVPDVFLEYGENPLFSTLVTRHPSQQLYDKVKGVVSLTKTNGFKRNFLHHLSLLDSGFESDLQGLFQKRKLSDDQILALVNQKDVDGMTPLMYAANNPQMIDQLIDMKADCDELDKRGFSIWHHLFLTGDEDSLRMFLYKMKMSSKEADTLDGLRDIIFVNCHVPVSLGLSFKSQIQNLVYADKRLLSVHPGIDGRVLSTHRGFRESFSKSLKNMADQYFYEKRTLGYEQQGDLSPEYEAKVLLATGASHKMEDVPMFILTTYHLEDPIDVCDVYATFVQGDLAFCFNEHSILIDGFNYMFQKTFKKSMEGTQIKRFIQLNAEMLLFAQDFLIPLALKMMMKEPFSSEHQIFFDLYSFFGQQKKRLSETHRILLKFVTVANGQRRVFIDYEGLAPYILRDRGGGFFAFCYDLNGGVAGQLEATLRKKCIPLPQSQPTLISSGIWRDRLAIHRAVIREKVRPYIQKLKEHDRKMRKKKEELERHALKLTCFDDLFSDVLKDICPNLEREGIDETLIKVNGRSVSFEIDGKEVVVKVRKKGEDIYDHAIIAQALEDEEEDVKEQYASAHYVQLSKKFADKVHDMICDKNPKVKWIKEELDNEALVIVVRHTRYFDYITKKGISFSDFKMGLKKAMEQSFRQARQGRFMSSITDLAHDETRPALFFILARFLGAINGVHLGTFKNIAESIQNLDISPYGLRDLGNSLTEKHALLSEALGMAFQMYLKGKEAQFIKDGKEGEWHEENLLLAIQESLSMTITSCILLVLYRLQQDDDMRNPMRFDDFLLLIEDVLIQPFCDEFLHGQKAEDLRGHYYHIWQDDFKEFKKDPSLLDRSICIDRRDDIGRDFSFQALHIFSSFLLASLPSTALNVEEGETAFSSLEKKRGRTLKKRRSAETHAVFESVKIMCGDRPPIYSQFA